MNYKMIGYVLGRILLVEAALMLFPIIIAIIYGETKIISAFVLPIILLLIIGLAIGIKSPNDNSIYAREGLLIVALSWVAMSLFGAVPFFISGAIPNFVDCLFETVSGFTTTGSTILTDVESMPYSLLFWRSFTHWVGGMGVLVFVMAVLPISKGRTMHIMRAEVPGPSVGKLSSKIRTTAKILYSIYLIMTLSEIILLVCGGMPLFDSLIHSFGSAGTGGFSNKSLSVGAYNNAYFEIVIGVFMFLFGINFNLYYFLLLKRFREVFRSEELLTYFGIAIVAVLCIAANITELYGSFVEALRYSFFQVSSVMTTTGFATADFNLWPTFSKVILVILMFFGACAGSTAGGIKTARLVILFKSCIKDLRRMIHPNAVSSIRFEGKTADEKTVRGTHLYLVMYLIIFIVSVALLSLEGKDMITTFTAVATCLNNVGPGLEIVGPMGSFASFSSAGKLLLSFNMLAGRLEIYPMLALCAPALWFKKRKNDDSE